MGNQESKKNTNNKDNKKTKASESNPLGRDSKSVLKYMEVKFEDVQILKSLFTGSTSYTYKAMWNEEIIAYKSFKYGTILHLKEQSSDFYGEILKIMRLQSPNICKIFGITTRPPTVGVLMEYCEYGDLGHFIRHNPNIPISEKFRILVEISSAMKYLHYNNICHFDLRVNKILVDSNITAKLTVIDYFLTKLQFKDRRKSKSYNKNAMYVAPEVIQDPRKYNSKSDVFSFAFTACIVITSNENPYSFRTDGNSITQDFNYLNYSIIEDSKPKNQKYSGGNLSMKVAMNPFHRPSLTKIGEFLPKEIRADFCILINKCWQYKESRRPDFDSIFETLKSLLSKISEPGSQSEEEKEEKLSYDQKLFFKQQQKKIGNKINNNNNNNEKIGEEEYNSEEEEEDSEEEKFGRLGFYPNGSLDKMRRNVSFQNLSTSLRKKIVEFESDEEFLHDLYKPEKRRRKKLIRKCFDDEEIVIYLKRPNQSDEDADDYILGNKSMEGLEKVICEWGNCTEKDIEKIMKKITITPTPMFSASNQKNIPLIKKQTFRLLSKDRTISRLENDSIIVVYFTEDKNQKIENEINYVKERERINFIFIDGFCRQNIRYISIGEKYSKINIPIYSILLEDSFLMNIRNSFTNFKEKMDQVDDIFANF